MPAFWRIHKGQEWCTTRFLQLGSGYVTGRCSLQWSIWWPRQLPCMPWPVCLSHSPDTARAVYRSPLPHRRRCLHCGSTAHSHPRSAVELSTHRRTASGPHWLSPFASSLLARCSCHASACPPASLRCQLYPSRHQLQYRGDMCLNNQPSTHWCSGTHSILELIYMPIFINKLIISSQFNNSHQFHKTLHLEKRQITECTTTVEGFRGKM